MKIVFYFYSSFGGNMFGLLLDEAKKFAAIPENEVYFAFCEGIFDLCLDNPTGNKAVCEVCTRNARNLADKNFGKEITRLDLRDFESLDARVPLTFKYSSGLEMRQIMYKEVHIGYSALSSYVQLTRNHDPLIDSASKKFFDTQLNQAKRLTDTFFNVIDRIRPDLVCTYNGRFNEVRPVFETAKARGVDYNLYEFVPEGDGTYHKVVFENAMPHDVNKNLWRIEECWNDPKLEEGENIKLGKAFFERRRSGIVAGDKVYVGNQKKGLLPEDWDTNKRNIGIFNSSEDEFVAVGGEYVSLSLYRSQLDGLKDLLEQFKEDTEVHFYLRIHPNLTSVRYSYHTELLEFSKDYTNLTVIKATDPISSYELMDACEKVVVFGSTMGLESAYWGKPVILLCCASYYYSDIAYVPSDKKELYALIKKDLEPKFNENVLKIGLYLYHKDPLFIEHKEPQVGVDYNPIPIQIFGKTIYAYHYQKLLGSRRLAAYWIYGLRFMASSFFRGQYTLPRKDASGKA